MAWLAHSVNAAVLGGTGGMSFHTLIPLSCHTQIAVAAGVLVPGHWSVGLSVNHSHPRGPDSSLLLPPAGPDATGCGAGIGNWKAIICNAYTV